jgi:hypothetical protein
VAAGLVAKDQIYVLLPNLISNFVNDIIRFSCPVFKNQTRLERVLVALKSILYSAIFIHNQPRLGAVLHMPFDRKRSIRNTLMARWEVLC